MSTLMTSPTNIRTWWAHLWHHQPI